MYKDFSKDTWNDFNRCIKGKKLYIFGAGFQGQNLAGLLGHGIYDWPVEGFIDSNPQISQCGKFPVYGLSKLQKDYEDSVVLISTDFPGKIAVLLEQAGIRNYFSYAWLTHGIRSCRKQKLRDKAEIGEILELLQDRKSKDILQAIIEKQEAGFADYSDISDTGEEYFLDEFFKDSGEEIFLDGGAFDGDSVEAFADWTKNRYKTIYSFEPDREMVRVLENKIHRYHDLHVIPKGLYDKKIDLSFTRDNKVYSSHITNEDTGIQISCTSLEEELGMVPFTFIKLDVEGAEIPALNGMKNIITEYRPKLAISIYHKENDIWEIPLFIHKLVPEYKLYIRHFGKQYFGTNLYACMT